MEIVELLHVVGAIFLVGPVAAAGMYAPRFVRAGDPGALELLRRLSLVFGVGTLVVGLLGFGLVSGEGHGWQAWVLVSIALWLIAVGLTLVVLVTTLSEALTLAREDGDTSALVPRALVGGVLPAVLYVVVAILMVLRPGA